MDRIPFFDTIHKAGGYVIQAHPFRERVYISDIRLSLDYVDAIEVYNGAQDEKANKFDPRGNLFAQYYADQTVPDSSFSGETYNWHDNCVRVAESKYLGAHVGYPLGFIDQKDVRRWTYILKVDDSWFKYITLDYSKLHFAAFVTTPVQKSYGIDYEVVNVIDFPYNGEVAFEYNK